MQEYSKGRLAALLALLLWGLMWGTAAAGDPGTRIVLAVTDDAAVGARAELVARVASPEGEPLEGIDVTFVAEVEFLNTFDTLVIGHAITDESGVARAFYVPRVSGEIPVAARVEVNGDSQEATGTLIVAVGPHLFHPEDPIHELRGRWDWLVQWIWLVILPGAAFGTFLLVMVLLWLIGRERGLEPSRGRLGAPGRMSWAGRPLIPLAGGMAILGAAFVLIVGITLRPWAGADTSWRTELNLTHDVPAEDYTRSIPTLVGAAPSWEGWRPRAAVSLPEEQHALRTYVGYGCASCHGLEGEGGVVGVAFEDLSASGIRKALRKGRGGMPDFSALGTENVDALMAALTDFQAAATAARAEEPAPAVTPAPAPTARPAAAPSPTPVAPAPTAAAGAVPTGTPSSVSSPAPATPGPTEPAPASPTPAAPGGPVSLTAATASITVDGDTSDWSSIPATQVTLQQIRPIPGLDTGKVAPKEVGLRVAVDGERIYVLVEVPDDYDYDPEDHGLSAAMAVMFRIDDPAAPHMGAKEENQRKSLGEVDIWHWELDCGPGEMSGGVTGIRGGNDPRCGLDDQWAKTPRDLENDGTRAAENSLAGVWDHTARAQGQGADGTWIFEMSRKLQTSDPDDAQFAPGMTAAAALAYWDPDESPDGWTGEGHLQSSSGGWIEVVLPGTAP